MCNNFPGGPDLLSPSGSHMQRFRDKNVEEIISPDCNTFPCYTNLDSFEYCQVKTHVPPTREPYDLNINFHLFNNGDKQLAYSHRFLCKKILSIFLFLPSYSIQ